MNNFVRHDPCPKCGSKDNLGVYLDGSAWCFGCGYHRQAEGMSVKSMERLLSPMITEGYGALPSDFSSDIPREPYAWLKKYSLTNEEISENKIGWSARNEMLIIPYMDTENKCFLWQGRYFPKRTPKVFTRGNVEGSILLPFNSSITSSSTRVVVVEDPISAIKLSRVENSTPVLGSNLSMHKAVLLSRYFSHLTLWLDPDMVVKMLQLCNKYKPLFNKVDFIVSKHDPKDHSTEEIKEYLKS